MSRTETLCAGVSEHSTPAAGVQRAEKIQAAGRD